MLCGTNSPQRPFVTNTIYTLPTGEAVYGGHWCMSISNVETSQIFMLLSLIVRLCSSSISYWGSCYTHLL